MTNMLGGQQQMTQHLPPPLQATACGVGHGCWQLTKTMGKNGETMGTQQGDGGETMRDDVE